MDGLLQHIMPFHSTFLGLSSQINSSMRLMLHKLNFIYILQNEIVGVSGNAHVVPILRPEYLARLNLNTAHQLLSFPVVESKACGTGAAPKQVPTVYPYRQVHNNVR